MKTCQGPCGKELPVTAFDLAGNARLRAKGHRRTKCRKCRESNKTPAPKPEAPIKRFTRPLAGVQRFLITSAQNATEIHDGFVGALEVAAEAMGAELVVIPYRYKNPTGWQSKNQKPEDDGEWWDGDIEPYLYNVRKKLCANLVLASDVRIAATAANPLSGFESLTGAESCIIGHPKMAFRSVPVPSGKYAKILSTTGTCTRRNWSDTKAGALARFHHYLGAVVVEIDGKTFHLRQINADRTTGDFIDKDKYYSSSGVKQAPPALAIKLGDVHVGETDPLVDEATFGAGGIVPTLQPKVILWDDLFNGYSVNPHHAGDPFVAVMKSQHGLGDVRAEVERAVQYVADRSKGRKSVIVPSNHDNFLARWVRSIDWRTNPANAGFYFETAQAMLASVRKGPGGVEYDDPFRYWVEKLKGKADITALKVDESFTVAGIECGLHGDLGPNGARGTIRNLSRLGTKVIIGHSHSPGIEEGAYQTGTSTPRKLEYTRGPSSWLNTHCVIYANGARSLITIIGNRWHVPA